jgi:hypothetical protein
MIESTLVQNHGFSFSFFKRKDTAFDFVVSGESTVTAAIGAETAGDSKVARSSEFK